MKAILVLLLVVASFFAYQGRQRITVLEADLEIAHQQLDVAQKQLAETQTQLAALKEQMAKEGVAIAQPGQPGAAPVVKKSGQWMFDPNRNSPLERGGKP